MRPLLTIGTDAPVELLRACGFAPAPLPYHAAPTPLSDAVAGVKGLGARGRRLLEPLLMASADAAPVLITSADAEQVQVFAVLRELARLGEATPPPVHLIDLCHLPRAAARTYNLRRLAELISWLSAQGGQAPHFSDAFQQKSATRQIGPWTKLVLTGTPIEDPRLRDAIADAGFAIAADETETSPPVTLSLESFADPLLRLPPALRSPTARAEQVQRLVDEHGAEQVLHLTIGDDEAAPWSLAALKRKISVPVLAIQVPDGAPHRLSEALTGSEALPARARAPTPAKSGKPPSRSRKSLTSVANFNTYQREWFAGVRARAEAGEPFAVVNANAPQEILRTLDVPFVVNQWWASIVAAKQQTRRYFGLLKERAFPTRVEPYSAQGLAALFDADAEQAPWGGLPRPDLLHAVASSDATLGIFDEWAHAAGAEAYVYARTVDPRWHLPIRWWDDLPERWHETLEPARLDLLEAELEDVIGAIEARTGRVFDPDRFSAVLELVNEQEEYYRRTRDLIARTVPAPIGVVDQMPATMVPQWHRGTEWARDAAKAFYEEVAERAAAGLGAVPHERIRLMWVGRGLWSDMGWYQRWEESHGAVFVWSMYLALAADGYIRRVPKGETPLRALAARFLTMGDELRLPGWAGPWHVHEAETHQVDGAFALADADPFVLRALEAAGVPVLDLGVDNFSPDGTEDAALDAAIVAFLEGPAAERAARRLA